MEQLLNVIERTWGYRELRPLQQPAMQAVLDQRDSLVVLPTGGGKSLCYQAPALLRGGTTVVVSPLIALMKDQVDGLVELGVNAVQLDSSLSGMQRSVIEVELTRGDIRLLFVSPERMATPDFCAFLQRLNIRTFAIDEAHCISHWGHDFRPEYRLLGRIKELFPESSVHAYTATATEKVRLDICAQLRLKNPEVLVGDFDRPNLSYRILPRGNEDQQVLDVCNQHKGEPGIIYCFRRKDVDSTYAFLKDRGFNAMPYHAGMEPMQRKVVSEAFAAERCDIVVATIAFGMGIDRSNIRYVLHTSMPKSIEHYQQETGRAGRDGLEADCVLLYSVQDLFVWQKLMKKSAEEAGATQEFIKSILKHLDDLDRYLRGSICRHKYLVEYFGQSYANPNCAACDICLGDTEPVADSTLIAQKILSCVARVKETYGVNHVISVLRGEHSPRVLSLGHDKLSTFGLLMDHGAPTLRDWIFQLIGQGVLKQEGAEYPVLKLNDASWEVMRKQRTVKLVQVAQPKEAGKAKKSKKAEESWEGVERPLFDELREFRKNLAAERGVPAYVLFYDTTLRELASIRPTTRAALGRITGINEKKMTEFGEALLVIIQNYAKTHRVDTDVNVAPRPEAPPKPWTKPKDADNPRTTVGQAIQMFRQGRSIDDVMEQTGRARGTVVEYLSDYLHIDKPADVNAWVDRVTYDRIAAAAVKLGRQKLKPIFAELDEKIPYETIRIVLSWLDATNA